MSGQLNAKEVKEKIRSFLEMAGPSLPVHVAKHMQMNTLFTSAFMSEMSSEGTVIISDMKIGGSPLYYVLSKKAMLENFINNLGGKEKEACLMLKEKKVLKDQELPPAIRVALRSLKDFAFPFKKDSQIYWRYFLFTESQVQELFSPIPAAKEPEKKPQLESKPVPKPEEQIKVNQELLEKQKEIEKIKKELEELKKAKQEPPNSFLKQKKPEKKAKKVEDKFFEEVKRTLELKKIILERIEKFDNKEVHGIIKIGEREYLLAAFNKKKIEESDILKTHKKSLNYDLPYYILNKGELSKKTKELIEAMKNLVSIEKIEEIPKSEEQ